MAWGLPLSGLLLGAAGIAHCTAMCAMPCALAARACGAREGCAPSAPPWRAQLALHAGRLTGYAALGAIAALSLGFLRAYSTQVSGLRPLWLLLQLGLLAAGLVVLVTGRLPAPLQPCRTASARPAAAAASRHAALRGFACGLGWALLPCAQLYAAVALAAMADGAVGGASVMLAFGLPGTAAIVAAPQGWRLLRRWQAGRAGQGRERPVRFLAADAAPDRLSLRMAGATTALAASWLLLQSTFPAVASWCG